MTNIPLTDEDQLDRIYQFVSLALLFVGLAFAASATSYLIDQESTMAQLISLSRYVFIIVIPVLCLFSIGKSIALQSRGSNLSLHDGFIIYRAYVRAITISWTMTFAALTLLMVLLEDTALPPKFYMRSVGAIMLVVFSISYLLISNSGQFANQGEAE